MNNLSLFSMSITLPPDLKTLSNGQLVCSLCSDHPLMSSYEVFLVHCSSAKHSTHRDEREKREVRAGLQHPHDKGDTRGEEGLFSERPQQKCSSFFSRTNFLPVTTSRTAPIMTSESVLKVEKDVRSAPRVYKSAQPKYSDPWALKDVENLNINEVTRDDVYWCSRGWKRGAAGNWEKDQAVEFDSDEESPP